MADADRVLDNLETDIHTPVMTYRRWVRIAMPQNSELRVHVQLLIARQTVLLGE